VIGANRAIRTLTAVWPGEARAARWPAVLFRARRLGVHARDAQLGAANLHLLQLAEDFLRHAFGQVDEAVIFADVDMSNEFAVEAGFIGNRTHDISRQHALGMTDFDAEGFHRRATFRSAGAAPFAVLARRAFVSIGVLVVVATRFRAGQFVGVCGGGLVFRSVATTRRALRSVRP
jgi:hypothetical protein